MKYSFRKKFTAVLSAVFFASLAGEYAETVYAAGSYRDTSYAEITVFPDNEICKVSPYIFGINDIYDIDGVTADVIKQTGPFLSSYNWENNASDCLIDDISVNCVPFADPESEENYSAPAMYTDILMKRAEELNIPVRLVTLQMMGYVANDADGPLAADEGGYSERWAAVRYSEDFSYSKKPDKNDGIVYVDEYAAYIANKYGTASEGGINGYFLDTEPDRWAHYYPSLDIETTVPDPAEFIERSVELSSHVKTIDDTALIFAPSLSGMAACSEFCDNYKSRTETFADYFLYGMKKAGEKEGRRLLDVFDVHYFAEYGRTVTDIFLTEDAFIMEHTRALYDETYFDNTPLSKEHADMIPIIGTLNSYIDRSYPGTKLSFSEYNFGGGDRMCGCIAEIDALGAFASNGVYLACLYPDENNSYQRAGINLYTDYDGAGSRVGNLALETSNGDDRSIVYAFSDENSADTVWVIFANKNQSEKKQFDITVDSDRRFDAAEIYTIGGHSPEISANREDVPEMTDNRVSVTLSEKSVCMLVLKTNDIISDSDPSVTDSTYPEDPGISDNTVSDDTDERPEEATIEINTAAYETAVTEITPAADEGENTGFFFDTENKTHDPEGIAESVTSESAESDGREFPFALKIVAVIAAVGCIIGIIYVIFIDK